MRNPMRTDAASPRTKATNGRTLGLSRHLNGQELEDVAF